MPRRRIDLIYFALDANRINAREQLPNMSQIQKWYRNGIIGLEISDVAFGEIEKGKDKMMRRNKAFDYIMTKTKVQGEDEVKRWHAIEKILFPTGAKSQNQKNDVLIVFNADKYGLILITDDKKDILREPKSLSALGVSVKTDAEAVAYIRQLIKYRDEMARQASALTGEVLPSWVGED